MASSYQPFGSIGESAGASQTGWGKMAGAEWVVSGEERAGGRRIENCKVVIANCKLAIRSFLNSEP